MVGPTWLSSRRARQALCVAPLLLAPLCGGSVARPWTVALAGLCGLCGLVVGVVELLRGRRVLLSWFALALALALVTALLQLVPLPGPLRALLAPGSDATLRQVLEDLRGYPAQPHPLSVDPAATANEALRLAGYAVLLLALGASFAQRGDGQRLLLALCGSAVLVALLGGLAALGVPLPAPLRVDVATRARLPAAFVNSNHMAALMAIGATGALAALRGGFRQRRRLRQGGLLAALLLLDAALVGTLSRGGIAGGLVGQSLVLLWPRRPAPGEERPERARRVALALAVPLGGGLLALGLLEDARGDLAARLGAAAMQDLLAPGSKVQAWREALPLLRGHLWLGAGRGAFENLFQGVNSLAGSTRFPYLENEALQALIDFGVPAALGIAGLLVAGMLAALRRLREDAREGHFVAHRVAAWVGLLMLALHNLVDFNLQAGGVAVPALVLCALGLAGRGRVRLHALVLVLPSAAVLMGAIALIPWGRSHLEDGARLLRRAEDPATSVPALLEAGAAAVRRHPLDSHLSSIVAARLLRERRPEALTWANRALQQNPSDVTALRVSALMLAAAGYGGQAAATLRHAIPRADRSQRQLLYRTVFALWPEAAQLPQIMAALPPAPWAPQVIDEALNILGASRKPRWPLLRALAQAGEGLGAAEALLWQGRAALALEDLDAAAQLGLRLAGAGQAPLLVSDLAGLLLRAGRVTEASRVCEAALSRAPGPEVLVAFAQVREQQGAPAEARGLLERALGLAADAPTQAAVHRARAALEERQGNLHRAEREREESTRLQP